MVDLTPEVLDRLKALLAKATPGPWGQHRNHLVREFPDQQGRIQYLLDKHDLDLAAATVNALPALLAAVERAEKAEIALRHIAAVAERALGADAWSDTLCEVHHIGAIARGAIDTPKETTP